MKIKVKTMNGDATLIPMFCEITGKQIGWRTELIGHDPVYISLEAISWDGKIKDQNLFNSITTF